MSKSVSVHAYDAALGTSPTRVLEADSQIDFSVPQKTTTNGTSGRSESITWAGIVQLSQGDYIELWVANTTDTNNVTVENMPVQILEA